MKLIITIVLLIFALNSFSQNYLGYYEQINRARLLAVDSSYTESAALFKKVLNTYDFVFARDCINAAEVSTKLDNDSLTGYFICTALKRGVPITYFEGKDKFKNVRSSPLWTTILDSVPLYKQIYASRINTEIRTEINTMFEKDQAIRYQYYKWTNFLLRPIIRKKWEDLNRKQVERIIEITKIYGFPGEKLIGIDLPEHHPKIDKTQFSAGMPIILFIHHYSQPNRSFDPMLLEEVFKGNLNNEHFATICDFEAKFGKNKYSSFGYYGFKHNPKNCIPKALTAKRKSIGLLSASEFKKLNKSKEMTKFWNQLK